MLGGYTERHHMQALDTMRQAREVAAREAAAKGARREERRRFALPGADAPAQRRGARPFGYSS